MNFYKKRFVFYAYIFFSIFLCLGGCKSEKVVFEEMPSVCESTVEKVTITQTENGKLKMIIEAQSATIDENGSNARLKLPIIKFYDKGSYVSTFTAESADIDLETYNVRGIGKCTIYTANGEHLQTTDMVYNAKKNLLYSDNSVKIKRHGQTVYGTEFNADINLETVTVKNQRTILD